MGPVCKLISLEKEVEMKFKLVLIFVLAALVEAEAQKKGNGSKGGKGNGGKGGKRNRPVPCTEENQGRCECGDESKGFQTYTFMVDDIQRCFTTYIPPDRINETLPLMILSHCYSMDNLTGIFMSSENSAIN